jgi:hypothetical protein
LRHYHLRKLVAEGKERGEVVMAGYDYENLSATRKGDIGNAMSSNKPTTVVTPSGATQEFGPPTSSRPQPLLTKSGAFTRNLPPG